MSNRLLLPAGLLALTFCVGCVQHCCQSRGGPPGSVEFGLPTVERARIVGEVDATVLLTSAESHSDAPHEYRALTATECQCLAVEHSAIGNLLQRERWTACLHHMTKDERRGWCLKIAVLRAASQEARNKSGADALKLYYGIAEVEAGLDAVDDALQLVAQGTAKIAQLRKQELTIPFDASEFERRRLSLESKRADLQATRAKLNAKLRSLLGFEQFPDAPLILPTEPLRATAEPLDPEVEVAHGLATRGELQVLSLLANSDERTTTEAIRSLLGGMHGLAGMAAHAAACKFTKALLGGHDPEPNTRRNQVAGLYRSRSNQISGEIRAAIETIVARRRQAALAQEQVDSWQRRIRELTERRTTGGASFVELIEAQLHVAEARAAVTTAVIDLKRAEVELRELQGALAAECCGQMAPTMTVAAGPLQPPSPAVEKLPPAPLPELKLNNEDLLPPEIPTLPKLPVKKTSGSTLFAPPPVGTHQIIDP